MAEVMRYAEMKDRGVEWIGEIPEEWNLCPAGALFRELKQKNNDNRYSNPLSFRYGEIVYKSIGNEESEDIDEVLSAYKIVYPDTIIINGLNLNYDFISQRVAIVRKTGIITSAYLAVYPDKERIYARYVLFLLKAYDFRQVFHGIGSGIRKTLKYSDFKNVTIVFPSMYEQIAIASYLDNQCSQIDDIIARAKASIEEYKTWKASVIYEAVTKGLNPHAEMKDSGVEWIGMIPRHWNTIALKHAASKIGSGKTPSGGSEVYSSEGIMFLRSQNVYNTGLVLDDVSFISEEIDEDMKNTRVQYKDVLLNITGGGSIGRCCLFDKMERANVNQHVCIIRTIKEKILPEYLRYFWNSACGPVVVEKFQTGGNRAGLNFEQIGSVKIPWPSAEEQQRVVTYLDLQCSEIDQIITEKKKLITDLESYKKSLIYEVVTGKRKVA